MKQLLRRLSRVGDSSQHGLCRSRPAGISCRSFRSLGSVPEGFVPVHVGGERVRFAVRAEALNHPVFADLLNQSAQEYGYKSEGALRIPCSVVAFERLMEAIRVGEVARLCGLSDEGCFKMSRDEHALQLCS